MYYFDLAGVAVFAASGVLAARDRDLDLLGVIVVAAITAIGGATLRDLLLDRHPIFWVTDARYLVVIIASAMLTVAYVRVWPPPSATLHPMGPAPTRLPQILAAGGHSIYLRRERAGKDPGFGDHRVQSLVVRLGPDRLQPRQFEADADR